MKNCVYDDFCLCDDCGKCTRVYKSEFVERYINRTYICNKPRKNKYKDIR